MRHIPFIPAVKAAGYGFKKMRSGVLLLSPCYYCVNDSIQLKCNVLTLLCDGRLCLCSNNHCSSTENRCAQSMTMLCSNQWCKWNCFLAVRIMGNVLKASSPSVVCAGIAFSRSFAIDFTGSRQGQALFQRDICVTPRGTLGQDSVTMSLGWGFRRSWLISLLWGKFASFTLLRIKFFVKWG